MTEVVYLQSHKDRSGISASYAYPEKTLDNVRLTLIYKDFSFLKDK